MTKKEFIEKYNLINTHVKGYFLDGRKEVNRTIYANKYGDLFVFYGDMYAFNLFRQDKEKLGFILSGEILAIDGRLGAGWSWYH